MKEIVGKQKVEYTSKRTQELVKGVSLHCVGTSNNVEGKAVETIFVSARSAMYDEVSKLPIGTNIEVSYNRWGSVEDVRACK